MFKRIFPRMCVCPALCVWLTYVAGNPPRYPSSFFFFLLCFNAVPLVSLCMCMRVFVFTATSVEAPVDCQTWHRSKCGGERFFLVMPWLPCTIFDDLVLCASFVRIPTACVPKTSNCSCACGGVPFAFRGNGIREWARSFETKSHKFIRFFRCECVWVIIASYKKKCRCTVAAFVWFCVTVDVSLSRWNL